MPLLARLLALFLAAGTAFAAPQMVIPAPGVAAKSTPANGLPSTAVRFNGDELFALLPGDEVELTLPSGKRHSYIYEQSVSHGGGMTTWIARGALGGDSERAIVTSGPGGSWGWMKTPYGEFRIYPGEGNDWLAERPPMNFAPRAGGSDSVVAPPDDASVLPFKGVPTLASPLAMQKSFVLSKAAPDPAFQADVMIIYTKDIANKLGAGLMPMLYNLIASSNQAYVDSEIALSLRLVYSMELDLPNSAASGDTLSSMANFGGSNASLFAPLTWQTGSVRDSVGADFVALVRDGPDDTGGIAYLLKNPTIFPTGPAVATSNAYSVNNFCASGCEGIFAHELGHNMGNAHDRATVAKDENGTVPASDGVFPYSYGHYFCTNNLNCNPFLANGPLTCTTYAQCDNRQAADFGTVMAYVQPRVMKFSNPGVLCPTAPGGQPCGLAGQDDNARSMNETRHNIAAYRNQTIASLPGSLQFTQTGYTATEAGGTLTFTVSRAGGSSGAVAVNYAVAGGSATPGTDFTAANDTLNWADGDAANKTITVMIAADAVTEGPESLIATLSAPAGAAGAHLGYPARAVGLIVEPWPIGGTMPAGFTTSADPAVGWTVATDKVFEGTHSLRSAQVFGPDDFSTFANSDLTYAGTLPAGPVAFAHKVSSYQQYGFFEFIVDGVTVLSTTGEKDWALFTYDLPTSGPHTLVWRFKNALPFACAGAGPTPPEGGSECADRAWIDAVSLPTQQSVTQFALNVSKSGTGTVTSSPAGIDCGATCTANFNSGTAVTLTAAAGTGFSFTGWSGGGCSGTGTCQVTVNAATSVTATFTASTSANAPRLANISTRGRVQTGNDVMIGGFVIGGTLPKQVLITARGPSLTAFGVTGAMANPTLQLFSGQTLLATNDDWQSNANVADITATGIAPADPLESALLTTLAPGAYTAIVSGAGGGMGVGIVEVFERDRPEIPLINISTRGQVQTGDNVMIGGFIIQGDSPQTVLITARGPSLTPFGITNALPNPSLQLFSGQTLLASNDDFGSASNLADIQATGVAPTNPLESAILVTLPPGAYTAIVTGVGGATGVGIVEVFAR